MNMLVPVVLKALSFGPGCKFVCMNIRQEIKNLLEFLFLSKIKLKNGVLLN
jgi:hypothetical protein